MDILVDNNLSVNEIMENESLFHDTTRSGVEGNKLEFSIISLTEMRGCYVFYTLNYVFAVHEKIVYCTLFEARK